MDVVSREPPGARAADEWAEMIARRAAELTCDLDAIEQRLSLLEVRLLPLVECANKLAV
jgi:hypothetical protein